MKAKEKIEELERRKQEIISYANLLEEKLRLGEINQVEQVILLHEKLEGKTKEEALSDIEARIRELSALNAKEQKTKFQLIIAGVVILIIALISIASQIKPHTTGLTGYVISEKGENEIISYNNTFATSTETIIQAEGITGLRISGYLEGRKAVVKLRVNETEYLVGEIVGEQDYYLTTDKEIYVIGETVFLTLRPGNVNASVYITKGEETTRLEDGVKTYSPQTPGEYQAIALIQEQDRVIRINASFNVLDDAIEKSDLLNEDNALEEEKIEAVETIESSQEVYEFNNLCVETCKLNKIDNPVLIIELEDESSVTITSIGITRESENNAPQQTRQVPNISMTTSQTAKLYLDDYFSDPDNDSLHYDINEVAELKTSIEGSELSISSDSPGVYTCYIYATDGDKLVTSNLFTVTVTAETITTTESEEAITPGENKTLEPEAGGKIIDPCANPNPNLRPPECIESREEDYFVLESVILKDNQKGFVARITPLGNLLIRGVLVEGAEMKPGVNDFKVTYMNDRYEDVPVAWIDSATGNLYLKGKLFEEDFFLQPTPGAFVIQNKRNVNLAYIDRITGDLHIKGNLIQLRKSLE